MENEGFESDTKIPLRRKMTSIAEPSKLNNETSYTFTTYKVNGVHSATMSKGAPKSDGTVRMKRQIGLFSGIAMIVGSIIGSGIFISPTGVFQRTGGSVSASLIVWAGCGLLSTLTAVTYCELGTVVPRSGGEHAYFQAAFKPLHSFWGEVPAFLFAFMIVTLLKPSALAVLCLSFAQYTILPILEGLGIADSWVDSGDHELAQKFIAVAAAMLVAAVNIFSAKVSAQIMVVFTVTKLFACALIIGIGIFNLSTGVTGSLPTEGFDTTEVSAAGIALSFYSGLWSYDGWNNLNYMTEELVNPNRNLPLAIFLGIPLATLLYTFMNAAYFTVLTTNEFMSGQPVGILVGDRMLGQFSFVMPVLIALSVYGTAHASMFTAGRISYVAGRDGHLLRVLSYVHIQHLTPALAIMLNTALGILFIWFNSVNKLIDSVSIVGWIFYALSMISFFILRWREPNAVRPFRVPAILPAIALLISVFLIVAPFIDKPGIEHMYIIGVGIIGLVLYYPFVYKKYSVRFMPSVTRSIQRIMLVAPSPYQEDRIKASD